MAIDPNSKSIIGSIFGQAISFGSLGGLKTLVLIFMHSEIGYLNKNALSVLPLGILNVEGRESTCLGPQPDWAQAFHLKWCQKSSFGTWPYLMFYFCIGPPSRMGPCWGTLSNIALWGLDQSRSEISIYYEIMACVRNGEYLQQKISASGP